MSTSVGGQVVCVTSELEYHLQRGLGDLPRLLIDPLGTFTLKGIPGQTALVQLSFNERMADFGNRRFVQSKKAQQVIPGDKFARIVMEAMTASSHGEGVGEGDGRRAEAMGGPPTSREEERLGMTVGAESLSELIGSGCITLWDEGRAVWRRRRRI